MNSKSLRVSAATALLALASAALVAHARPNRYGHSDREERHMFPAVSAGPLDPAWSPDGRWIAFSMRGDIWKVPAEGGEAVALTSGPAYHYEPAWSPDGRSIALTMDVGDDEGAGTGDLDVGVVSADGGAVRRISPNEAVDLQPAWSRDGRTLYFASARERGWRIYAHDVATGRDTMLVNGIQPAVSPDGRSLAYERGGIRVLDLATGESRTVRDEEMEYRARPVWTPDGRSLLYVTEDRGSNDIRIIAADGGRPLELTIDDAHHEMSPTVSPDGSRFAFVAFRAGVPTLYTAPIAGGPPSLWREVEITGRRAVAPTGRVRVVVTGPDGRPVAARISVAASDGRGYSPDGAFHRAMMVFDHHYFHAPGPVEVEVPAGRTRIEAVLGFEYVPATVTLDVPAGGTATATLALERMIDLPARGWWSGDTHVHDLHQGFGLTHEAFFLQLAAEDLHVTNALIHMDGTRIMGRWEDLTGAPHPLSTPMHILQYAQEFRGGLGHIGMIGIHDWILPFVAGQGGTPYGQHTLDTRYVEGARAQGGLAGFMHPYIAAVETPRAAAGALIALDVALGLGDFYDVASLWSDELASTDFYYRILNAGFRMPATGGTDQFSDVFRDPPPGSARTFARIDGPLSVEAWLDAVRRGRTFASTGPILLLEVDGHQPGDAIELPAGAPARLRVRAEALSIAPLDSLEIIVNGESVHTARPGDDGRITFEGEVVVPEGGWVAARALGPASPLLGDDYAFAQTSPVYVTVRGRTFVNPDDVRFLAQTVDAIWARVEDSGWRSDDEKAAFRAAVDSAKAVYARRAAAR